MRHESARRGRESNNPKLARLGVNRPRAVLCCGAFILFAVNADYHAISRHATLDAGTRPNRLISTDMAEISHSTFRNFFSSLEFKRVGVQKETERLDA